MAGEIKIPGAIWAPFSGKSTTQLVYETACIHTQVGFNQISYNLGAQPGHSYAHTYLDGDGSELQGQDLRYRAAANLEGNPYTISWECADHGPWFSTWNNQCGNVPDFTEAQVATLIRDLTWACLRFNIPPVLIPDTKPGRRGLAYHAQGIVPNLVVGGRKWSLTAYKCCPDWRRIRTFVNRIIPAVRKNVLAILNPEEDDMWCQLVRGPGKPTRIVTSNGHVMGFPSGTELTETLTDLVNGGYTRAKDLVFREVDDWERYFTPRPLTQADLLNIAAAIGRGFKNVEGTEEGDGIYVADLKSIGVEATHQALDEHGVPHGDPPM
jgi:hypothetical protein